MTEVDTLEREIMEKSLQLAALRKNAEAPEIEDYAFETGSGEMRLSDFFAGKERLLVIHNMGQGCRYCALWADGLNGILEHLEDAASVVLVSKDPPETQRRFAIDRGWKFRTASHGGGRYMKEQCAMGDYDNCPGAAFYERHNGKIVRRGRTPFGPGDLYSPMWHLLALGGLEIGDWTPQYHYWRRPEELDDGGEDIRD